jgi:ribonuclease III
MIHDESRHRVEQALGYRFNDPSHLVQAMTHASVAATRAVSYERLEFLGDAVLGMVVSESLFRRFPSLLEGEMTKIKSSVVSRQTCAAIARGLGLDGVLLLGKGMVLANGNASTVGRASHLPPSLAAAVFESMIAAIFLDGGFEAVAGVLRPIVDPLIDKSALSGHQENFKSVLQQHAQQDLKITPVYRVLDERGPDHSKIFRVGVELGGVMHEPAWGLTKKQAEQLAALKALRSLGQLEMSEVVAMRLRAEPAGEPDAATGAPGAVPPDPTGSDTNAAASE